MPIRGTAVALLTLFTVSLAPAGPLPIAWSTRSPTNTIALPDGVTGGFSFPNTVFEPGGWDGDVAITPIRSFSVAQAITPDRVTDLPYQFAVELRDDASGETAQFTFAGELSGTIWRGGTDLQNQFTGLTGQEAELGGYTYRIELTGFNAPTGYGDAAAGEITARVSVLSPSDDPIDSPIAETPEPGSMVLGAVALGAGGVAFFRRKLRQGRADPNSIPATIR